MYYHGRSEPSLDALAGLLRVLRELPRAGDDAARVEQIRLLEELKSAAAAVQAQVSVEFVASQRQAQLAAGVPVERAERGVAAQIGLARKVSPFHAQRYVGWVKILTAEMPRTLAALRAGQISEWRAMLVARETAWLSREHRARVDAEVAPKLSSLGDKRVVAAVRTAGYRLDPDGYVGRLRNVESERRVSLRPAPDAMARLTALLPVAQGVAAYAALGRDADTHSAAGDARSRGQAMADTLVERITGQTTAADVPLEVHLVMDANSLLDNSGEPAVVVGAGPIPAATARDLVLAGSAPRWLRRMFTEPTTGELVAMETRRRLFAKNQRRFVELRDQTCRTPYCDAPIRHIDHIVPVEHGGRTSINNAQGLCVACNHAKQAPGWHARPGPGELVTITTRPGTPIAAIHPDHPEPEAA